MTAYGLPIAYALFVWWFSTGLILYLDGLPQRTFRWSMIGATAVLALALWGLAATRDDATVVGAYAAFTCGVLVWGWHELSFLTGFVTGPRTTPLSPGFRGWRRLAQAVQAILYHEVAIAVTAIAVMALTRGGENQVGAWTFLILWGMRLSAKLNVFLGVPNLGEEFLPDHLRYLESFFARRPMNLLFPVSVTVSTALAAGLIQTAAAPEANAFQAAGFTFLATLTTLAVLEHWFFVLPLPVIALWRWGLRSRAAATTLPPDIAAGILHNMQPKQVTLAPRRPS